jgi:hypothetical protein
MAQPGIPRRFRPLLQQAQAEANVRFGGERSGLLALIAAAQDTYRKSVQQAHSAAAILGAATQQAQNTLADPSNPITSLAVKAQAMPGTEGAIVAQNLGLTANSARSLIAEQGVNAAAAQKYQGQQALGQFRSDLGKVQGQQQDLASRYGDYVTGRYDSMVQADRKQRHDANQAARDLAARFALAGVNQRTGKIVPGGASDPTLSPSAQKSAADLQFFRQHGYYPPTGPPKAGKGAKGAAPKPEYTPAQITGARREFNAGVDYAGQLNLRGNMPRNAQTVKDIAYILLNGGKGSSAKLKAVVKDPFLAQAAAERYVYGYVLPATNRRLNKEYGIGAKVKPGPKYVPPGNYAAGPVGA